MAGTGQPRDASGQFAPGYLRWTREDGESRWIWWPREPEERAAELAGSGYRMLSHALVIVVAIALLWFLW